MPFVVFLSNKTC